MTGELAHIYTSALEALEEQDVPRAEGLLEALGWTELDDLFSHATEAQIRLETMREIVIHLMLKKGKRP